MLRPIARLEGKTIQKAEQGGEEYHGRENRSLQLTFTDGTVFVLEVSSGFHAEGLYFVNREDDVKPKRLFKG